MSFYTRTLVLLSAVWSRSKFKTSVMPHVMPHIFSNCPCISRRKKYASSTGWALNRGQRVWRATRTTPARSTSNTTMKCTTYFTYYFCYYHYIMTKYNFNYNQFSYHYNNYFHNSMYRGQHRPPGQGLARSCFLPPYQPCPVNNNQYTWNSISLIEIGSKEYQSFIFALKPQASLASFYTHKRKTVLVFFVVSDGFVCVGHTG